MMPCTNYEMTEADLQALLAAFQPTPVMMIGGYDTGSSKQENANAAWARLGSKMGFDHMTVRPVSGKGQRFFTAVPNESAETIAERTQHQALERKAALVATLEAEIAERTKRLADLIRKAPAEDDGA